MQLTNKQEQALHICIERYRNKEPYTVIAGYAGTGKSTIVSILIEALELDPLYDVAYIAYTGKAAQVLRSKGNPKAMTAHKLLYKSFQDKKTGEWKHIPKNKDDIGCYKLIVVDEVSMLPQEMWKLLLSYQIPIIACGDPFQLPAIGISTSVLDSPNIFLDEIMRQAEDSEIIRLTMDIRNHKPIVPFKGNEINVVPHSEFCDGMMQWADEILCGKNATRYTLNQNYRKLVWGNNVDLSKPIVGDKIICLKNNWNIMSENQEALVNGTIGYITDIHEFPDPFLNPRMIMDFKGDSGEGLYGSINADYKLLTTNIPSINKDNFGRIPKVLHPEQFAYGYVVTTHKAQGSEFDKVLVIEEKLKGSDHARWLYTACTRAAKKLTLVLQR